MSVAMVLTFDVQQIWGEIWGICAQRRRAARNAACIFDVCFNVRFQLVKRHQNPHTISRPTTHALYLPHTLQQIENAFHCSRRFAEH
jgi:hypothetical protein